MSTGVYKRIREEPFNLFIKKVHKTSKCWIWIGSRDKGGYGKFVSLGENMAHRFSYRHYIGIIPKGLFVCHSCDNPSCVRPNHLWVGTAKENSIDCVKKGRTNHTTVYGEQNGLSKLKKKQIIKIVKMYKNGSTQLEISKKFHCHQTNIHYILSNKTWKHVKKELLKTQDIQAHETHQTASSRPV